MDAWGVGGVKGGGEMSPCWERIDTHLNHFMMFLELGTRGVGDRTEGRPGGVGVLPVAQRSPTRVSALSRPPRRPCEGDSPSNLNP